VFTHGFGKNWDGVVIIKRTNLLETNLAFYKWAALRTAVESPLARRHHFFAAQQAVGASGVQGAPTVSRHHLTVSRGEMVPRVWIPREFK
jgi:hypothetical protein